MSEDTFTNIFRDVNQPEVFKASDQQAYYDALIDNDDIDGEELIPIPDATHALKYVSLRRLRPGGDLHGTLELKDVEL